MLCLKISAYNESMTGAKPMAVLCLGIHAPVQTTMLVQSINTTTISTEASPAQNIYTIILPSKNC